MELYHYIPWQFGVSNIEKRRIKIARITEVNDPYDCLPFLMDEADTTGEGYECFRNWFDTGVPNKIIRHQGRPTGIICFSNTAVSPLMWGHYADNHRGMVLAFEVLDGDHLIPVNYKKSRWNPEEAPDTQGDEKFTAEFISRKSADWFYEQECRLYTPLTGATENGIYFKNFDEKIKLIGVVLGWRCSAIKEAMQVFLEANGFEGIWVKKATLHPTEFEMKIV